MKNIELEREISKNYEAFSKMGFTAEYTGKFALMHREKLVDILDSRADAHKLAQVKIGENSLYSVQEINPRPLDLGFQQHRLLAN